MASLCNLWDLCFQTKDWTLPLAVKEQSPNHWTTREFPTLLILNYVYSWMLQRTVVEGVGRFGGWCPSVQFSSVQSLSHVRLFATPWTAACQASLSITNFQSSLKLMSIESVMPSSHLIPFSCPQALQASGSFPMSQLFASGGQSIGVSASTAVLPMNTQDWSPLGGSLEHLK